jgi:hypothetical protein
MMNCNRPQEGVEQAKDEPAGQQREDESFGLETDARQDQRCQAKGQGIGDNLHEHETPVELESFFFRYGHIL